MKRKDITINIEPEVAMIMAQAFLNNVNLIDYLLGAIELTDEGKKELEHLLVELRDKSREAATGLHLPKNK